MTKLNSGLTKALFFLAVCGMASQAMAATTSRSGGGSSNWIIGDQGNTSNGQAAGGFCTFSGGSGATIIDANIPGQGDAFDLGSMLFVDNQVVGGPMTVSGSTVSFAASSHSGLSVQTTYEIMQDSATARNYTTFTNPSGSAITVTVDFATNFGSDGNTQITSSSSGDLFFGTDDRWVVTDDAQTNAWDPANTTVFFGPDSPPVTPTSVSTTVFNCAGPQGLLATYSLTVPAGQTVAMMFFHQLNGSAANAQTNAAVFDTTPQVGDSLAVGLTSADLARAVNWGAPDSDGDGVNDNDDLCPDTASGDAVDSAGCSDAQVDGDGDGVCDPGAPSGGPSGCSGSDACAGTAIPETAPSRRLGTNRWALMDGDFNFDTKAPRGRGSGRSFTVADTAGCSCEQIIATCGYGKGHSKHGCSNSVMDAWTGLFDAAGDPPQQCED